MPARHSQSFSSPELEAFLQTCDTAVLPISSIETHGPHLSLQADTLVGEAILAQASARIEADLLILPTLDFAIVLQHGLRRNPAYPGIYGVSSGTLMAVVGDIAGCLQRDGIRKLLLLNFHGGNSALIPVMGCQVEADYPGLYVFSYFITQGMDWGGAFPGQVVGHGCAAETSLNLALCPDYVWLDTKPPANQGRGLPFEPPARFQNFPDWVYVTRGMGYVGEPMKASAEVGNQLVEQALAVMVPSLEQLARLDVSTLEPREKPNAPLAGRSGRE